MTTHHTDRHTDPRAHPSVSAIVVCFNEENNIGGCLDSLRWCDEIIVVDSFSTDRTVEISRQYTDRIVQRQWAGYRDQKAFAHSLATKDWVLVVDSDERVTPELRDEIKETLALHASVYTGFSAPRVVFYLKRWWWRGGWYPNRTVRLFRRGHATWGGTEPHEKILIDGKVRRLRNPLHHFSYRDIEDHVQRINRFTSISSRELFDEQTHWRLGDALLRPAFRFFRSYILNRGFLEGFAGFYVALMAAVYVFLKYAKLWELELEGKNNGERKRPEPPA
jgi:glycosyltransferase involved in cell wall biosynthesis